MEGVSIGRSKNYSTGELKPYDWKGNITLLKPFDPPRADDTLFVSTSDTSEMYYWQEGSYLDEEIILTSKCLIQW